MSMLKAALAYADLGLAVFPLAARSKVPAGGRGCKDASHEPDEIRAMWRDPDSNVGIATGYGSDILVLDVDGPGGVASLRGLEAVNGALPQTPTVVTSRGEHMYFRYPGAEVEIGNSAGKLGNGLDVRTDGGYVVAPPSVHPSGETYQWADGCSPRQVEFAWMPDWLISKLVKRSEPAQPYEPGASNFGETPYGRKALEAECSELARTGEGQRNERLNAVAFRMGQLVASGHLTERALAEVTSAGKACGLGEREVRKTVWSGYTAGLKKLCSSDPDPNERRQQERRATDREQAATKQDSGIKSAERVAQEAVDHLTDQSRRGMPRSGFGILDRAIGGLPPGAMFTVGGRTGAGKSSLLLGMAVNQSRDGRKIGIVSCEDPEWVWGARILCLLNSSLSMDDFFQSTPDPSKVGEAKRAVQDAKDLGIHMAFQVGEAAEAVGRSVATLVEREQCSIVMVDYLQALSVRGKERYGARTDDAELLKQACHSRGVPLVLASQLKRPEAGNPFREPSNNDLKDTGDIENKSELIVLLWQTGDEENAPVIGKVSKVKWSARRPRFEIQRHETSGALVDLIAAPKEQSQANGKKRARPDYSGFAPEAGYGY